MRIPESIRERAWRACSRLRDYGFRPRLSHDPAAPVVVLSPHLDDAVIDCWFPQADHRTGPPPPLSAIDRALARHVPSAGASCFTVDRHLDASERLIADAA